MPLILDAQRLRRLRAGYMRTPIAGDARPAIWSRALEEGIQNAQSSIRIEPRIDENMNVRVLVRDGARAEYQDGSVPENGDQRVPTLVITGPGAENQNPNVVGTAHARVEAPVTRPAETGAESKNDGGVSAGPEATAEQLKAPRNNPMTRDEIMSMWLSRLQTGIEPDPIPPVPDRGPIYRYPGRVMMHPEHERIVRRALGKERILVPPIQQVAGGSRPYVHNSEPPKPMSAYIKLWNNPPPRYIPKKYRAPPRRPRPDRPPNPDLYLEKALLDESQRWLDTQDRLKAVAGRRLLRKQLFQIGAAKLPPGQPANWDTHCNYILWTSRGTVSMITERLQALFGFDPPLQKSFVAERLNGANAGKHAEFLKEFAPGEAHSIQRAEARFAMHKAKRDDPKVRNGSQVIEVEQFNYDDSRYEKPRRLYNAPVDWNRDDDAILFLYLGQDPRKFLQHYGWVFKGALTDPFIRVRMGQVTHLGFTELELARARERYGIIQANIAN
ncbi:uncharacterized protein ACLA_027700 [Aspergillus clavatus NRRL 1]|uniref:Uncharacterized protein n=1 Tax=Aspergillus clavatus (strain ATCC 1007 / CBS 513.65 / DSM 816 / NCTC 3887 / NRRL 1 / QM 1276 / 107) TaxID=344612 RepID=A1CQX4_ASPCL|nr:uncharacterized protein ACLA_027700 [Aspergillus clavatus NRRL 1]EAW08045.1 hypothetical protein ACLA_027700 [Aspergillus clavatus NRRL 1]